MYALSALSFLYAESYKGFHLKFNRTYVTRSHRLPGLWKLPVLNVLYSGGWVKASSKRLKTSWGITIGVAMIVAVSKRLPPVARGVLDVGVVSGLGGAVVSLWWIWATCAVKGETTGEGMEGY